MARFGSTPGALLKTYGADRQELMTRNAELVFLGSAPTLGTVSGAYGRAVAVAWIELQLVNLSEFAGCKGKISPEQLGETAQLLLSGHPSLRLTELMLFFRRFKQGRYGRFYGSVDPMAILEALDDFEQEKSAELENFERRESARRNDAEDQQRRALVELYHRRVAEADRGFVDLFQFRMLRYHLMDDAEFAAELARLRSGEKVLPDNVADLLRLAGHKIGTA